MIARTTGLSFPDLLVVWCSVRGDGSRAEFNTACRNHRPSEESATRLLGRLELMGYIDVDWERSGRWQARPTTITYIEGSGGNALIAGARTGHTWKTLRDLERSGALAGLPNVVVGGDYPASWFVAVRSSDELTKVAVALESRVDVTPAEEMLRQFGSVAEIVATAGTEFTPSGFAALKFDVDRLRFGHMESPIRWGNFPPGCYEQRSRGRNRYVFVDDEGSAHLLDRWVAIHAELARQRRAGTVVRDVLRWDHRTGRMVCLSAAQLPTPLARAAVLCSGLPPRRSTSGQWTDIYEGIKVQLYARFCRALDHPRSRSDLSAYDEEDQ